MTTNDKIRTLLTFTITVVVLIIALLTASYPIYLEALRALSIPFGIVIAGWFGVGAIKNNRKKDERKS